MSDTTYASAVGFIQFDPQVREANGQTVTDVTIKAPGTEGKLIRVTVWPEFNVSLEKGDFIAVDGKLTIGSFEGRDGQTKQSIQLSASSLVVIPGVKKSERTVVNQNTGNDLAF